MQDQVNQFVTNSSQIRRLLIGRFQTLLLAEGISSAQADALFFLINQPGPVQPKDMATGLMLTPGAVSQLLDGLNHAGFIVRTPSETDRRITSISLAPAATTKIERLKAYKHALATDIANLLTTAELERAIKTQQKILHHLQGEQHGKNQSPPSQS